MENSRKSSRPQCSGRFPYLLSSLTFMAEYTLLWFEFPLYRAGRGQPHSADCYKPCNTWSTIPPFYYFTFCYFSSHLAPSPGKPMYLWHSHALEISLENPYKNTKASTGERRKGENFQVNLWNIGTRQQKLYEPDHLRMQTKHTTYSFLQWGELHSYYSFHIPVYCH